MPPPNDRRSSPTAAAQPLGGLILATWSGLVSAGTRLGPPGHRRRLTRLHVVATVTGRMENTHAGRHDSIIGAGFAMGMCGGALLIVGELVGLPDALWALGIVLFLLGLVCAVVGAGLASRSTGNGWLRSFAGGVRAAFRFLVEFLP